MGMEGGGNYPVLASSQIRILAGSIGFALLYAFTGKWKETIAGIKKPVAMAFTAGGSLAGPVIGVSLSLLAVSNTQAGVASTLMSITPVLIVPLAAILFKEKIRARDLLGALVTVAGVALMFVNA
jgi:drug/metabolite transporter (DMT)-like permease